jgi:RecJ-like exonuclease
MQMTKRGFMEMEPDYDDEKMENESKAYVPKSRGKKCKTCNGEGVVWVLSPCQDCVAGKRVEKLGSPRYRKTI